MIRFASILQTLPVFPAEKTIGGGDLRSLRPYFRTHADNSVFYKTGLGDPRSLSEN